MMSYDDLFYWIQERYRIKLKRDRGLPPPWSDDRVFQSTHFCNVHREDDKVTRWVRDNWRNPHASDADLWFAMLVARRCLNNPASMADLGYPVPWDEDKFRAMCKRRGPGNIYRSRAYKLIFAYVKGSLPEAQLRLILNPAWERREYFRPQAGETLWSFHKRLRELSPRFMTGFFCGQVVADLKMVQLRNASDWWDYAVSGPGSRRGLTRFLGGPVKVAKDDVQMSEDFFRVELDKIRGVLDPMVKAAGIPPLDASDMQGVLCEFDKYERVRSGQTGGRKFRPTSLSRWAVGSGP
jgi:hypothetical protein